MKFIDPKSDIAFKKIFGDEQKKFILISFLNAVLNLEGEKRIKDVEILIPYQTPKIKGLKETVLDVSARDETGREFIVEMQIREKEDFTKRALFYTAQTYTQQLKSGDSYNDLKPVVFIGILNFNIFPTNYCVSQHLIIDPKSQMSYIKDFEFNFIELPKFNKTVKELDSIIDKWIYFLKEARNLKVIPENTPPEIKKAYETANQFGWNEDELNLYRFWEIEDNENKNLQEREYEKGLEKGIEKGLEKGIKKGKEEGIKEGIEKGKEEGLNIALQKLIQAGISEAEAKKMLGV